MGLLKAFGWALLADGLEVAEEKRRDDRLVKRIAEEAAKANGTFDYEAEARRNYDQRGFFQRACEGIHAKFDEAERKERRAEPARIAVTTRPESRWCDGKPISARANRDTSSMGFGLSSKAGDIEQAARFFAGTRWDLVRIYEADGRTKVADVRPDWFRRLYTELPSRNWVNASTAFTDSCTAF